MLDVRRVRLATLGGMLAAGLVLAACGGGSTHSAGASVAPTTTTTVPGGRGGAAFAAFTSCMSSHGISLPSRARTGPSGSGGTPPSTTPGGTRPRGGGGFGFGGGNFADRFNTPPAGVDPTKYAAALTACRSKLPTAPAGGTNNSAFQAYRSCLSDHGVTLPATGRLGSINRNDPKVKAALTACRALLPTRGFGGTTTTTAPPA
jgi:hypothetical protein